MDMSEKAERQRSKQRELEEYRQQRALSPQELLAARNAALDRMIGPEEFGSHNPLWSSSDDPEWLSQVARPDKNLDSLPDPMAQADWSFVLALGWIMTRDAAFLRPLCRQGHDGLLSLSLEAAHRRVSGGECGLLEEAEQELWQALSEGSLSGSCREGPQRIPLHSNQWQDLELKESGGNVEGANRGDTVLRYRGGFEEKLSPSLRRDEILSIWPVKENATGTVVPVVYRTGSPGRPTSMHIVLEEAERRLLAGVEVRKFLPFAKDLAKWLADSDRVAPQLDPETIAGNAKFKSLVRRVQADRLKTANNTD